MKKLLAILCMTFILAGFGFLTKGPIAVLIPLLVSMIYLLSLRRVRTWAQSVFNWKGITLFLAVAAPWYLMRTVGEGADFIGAFFLEHNVGRFRGPMQGHSGSLFYYIPVVFLSVFPFTAVAIGFFIRIRRYWQDEVTRFLLTWILFVIVFFSLSGTKLPHYTIYGLPALFLLMGRELKSFRCYGWILGPAIGI